MQRGDEEARRHRARRVLGIQIVLLALGAIVVGPRMFAFLLEPYVWIPNAIVLTVVYVLSNEKLTPNRPKSEDRDA